MDFLMAPTYTEESQRINVFEQRLGVSGTKVDFPAYALRIVFAGSTHIFSSLAGQRIRMQVPTPGSL